MQEDVEKFDFKRMEEVHHILSGFKAVLTDDAMHAIETCRRACGGAGYSAHSAFADIFNDASPNPTWEGENTVMLLQAAKLPIKLLKRAQKGKPLAFPFEYIASTDRLLTLKSRINSVEDCLNLDLLAEALATKAASYLVQLNREITRSQES